MYLERPVSSGEAIHEFDPHAENEFPITIGLRVEPNAIGGGNSFTREVQWGLMPPGFYRAIEETALQTCDVLGTVIGYLSTHEMDITKSEQLGPDYWLITGECPARLVQEVTMALPGLTRGEGALFSYPGSDRPLRSDPPVCPRTDGNPLNYEEYMRFLSRGGTEA
jgi:hypothetical protein